MKVHDRSVSIASDMIGRDNRKINKTLMTRLQHESHKYQAKRSLFMVNNTISIVLSLYNLLSVCNIEAYSSFYQYEETNTKGREVGLLYYIILLAIVHFLRIFVNIIGFFGINQKSQKILTMYMLLTCILFVIRGILAILIVISYSQIKMLLDDFYVEMSDDDQSLIAVQYCILIMLFVVFDAIITLISIVQGSNGRETHMKTQSYKDKIRQKYYICYNDALETYF